ncbi:MAG: hypothetical protein WBQ78_02495 [Gammaproteobacteria bacterium]
MTRLNFQAYQRSGMAQRGICSGSYVLEPLLAPLPAPRLAVTPCTQGLQCAAAPDWRAALMGIPGLPCGCGCRDACAAVSRGMLCFSPLFPENQWLVKDAPRRIRLY